MIKLVLCAICDLTYPNVWRFALISYLNSSLNILIHGLEFHMVKLDSAKCKDGLESAEIFEIVIS
jgi:hypothetical protein